MANFIGVTASSGAKIKSDMLEALKALIEKYDFSGWPPTIEETEDGACIQIDGYDWFDAQPIESEDCESDFEGFLRELAPMLEEPLTIQCIGSEKCRFPLSAWECTVFPDGTIQEASFFNGQRQTGPNVAITMEGGLIQDVNADQPVNVYVADFDTEGTRLEVVRLKETDQFEESDECTLVKWELDGSEDQAAVARRYSESYAENFKEDKEEMEII